nr:Chain E, TRANSCRIPTION FACTOR E2F1 [Homo sapiens]
PVKRRLDLE